MFRIQVFVLFICLFTCLFICLFAYLFIYLFSFLFSFISFFISFCSFAYIDFVYLSISISFLSICIVLFLFIFIFDSKISKEKKATKPHQTTPTYVLNFPSFVCVYEEAQAGQKQNAFITSRTASEIR